ncbi:hypothetical protein [Oceanobacter mangrovi]|uniref:hypothetical protein n=1 Tax=Oceanobacter mangrovi TaxID=2862510 RepID=UPI001C8EA0AA|nr:hypothetical protein [Oceanobacter mangrovi]
MLLGSLTSYLQNQANTPLNDSEQVQQSAAVAKPANSGISDNGQADYQPSTRAILISAIATDVDVTTLPADQLGQLQQTLQQYGLISQKDLTAFTQLRLSMTETSNNALEALDQLANREQPYQSQQALKRVQTIFHNLNSAHQELNPAAA